MPRVMERLLQSLGQVSPPGTSADISNHGEKSYSRHTSRLSVGFTQQLGMRAIAVPMGPSPAPGGTRP